MTTRPRALLVAGMHRSGTSATAGCLHLLGGTLPRNVLPPMAGVNEAGFWEPRRIVDLHEEILAAAGSAWYDPAPLSRAWFESAIAGGLPERLASAYIEEYGGADLAVLKDPRLCRLLLLWVAALARIEVTPLFVIPYREPLAVVTSLGRRDGFTPETSLRLWLLHVLLAERDSRGTARAFVGYEDLLARPGDTLSRLTADLGVVWPRPLAESLPAVEAFLEKRPADRGPAPVASAPDDLLRAVGEVHALLAACRGRPGPGEEPAFDRWLASLLATGAGGAPRPARATTSAPRLPDPTPATPPGRPPEVVGWRGLLGRWLRHPSNRPRAASAVLRLRRAPGLSSLATELEIALTRATGLFDERLYDEQSPPASRPGVSALRHYVLVGDRLGLQPMSLFDPAHYAEQLDGRRHPGINRLLHFALVGRGRLLSPSPWFDPVFYLGAYDDVRQAGHDPLTHFVNFGLRERRRPNPFFSPAGSSGRHFETGSRDALRSYVDAGHADPTAESVPAPPVSREIQAWRTLRPRVGPAGLDVVVPVYAGFEQTLRCLWSVLSAAVETPFELVIIDDRGPEPELSTFLAALAEAGLATVHQNPANLGFVAAANAGMSLHADRDIVLLNADTCVYPGWLDRLVAHGAAVPRAGSVTPLSNNATICSYPRFLNENRRVSAAEGATLDVLAAEANAGAAVEVPTGVGFCLWLRRACLEKVGGFDLARFGRGYGEENDWCLRATAAGFVHLAAADVYVWHEGSVSFGSEAVEQTRKAMLVMEELHPGYAVTIQRWVQRDPLRPARVRLDAARLRASAGPHAVLLVSHWRGGGTARYEADETRRLWREKGRGVVSLRPSATAGAVALGAAGLDLPNLAALAADPVTSGSGLLIEALEQLGLSEVRLLSLVDFPARFAGALLALKRRLQLPLVVAIHDYHAICPRINLVDASGVYCGEPDAAACHRCLSRDETGRRAGDITGWRAEHGALLRAAERVQVPDRDVRERLARHFPGLVCAVVPHEPTSASVVPSASRRPVRHVVAVGAITSIKGFAPLLGLARSALVRRLGLRVSLLGYSSDDDALRAAGVELLGAYDDEGLPARLEALDPDLILIPSVWPETYCYVLTAALASGRRVAVFDLGAQATRPRDLGADAIYLPLSLAHQPELLARRVFGIEG